MTNQGRTKAYLKQRKDQCPRCRHHGRDVRYRINHDKVLCNNCAISRQHGDVKRNIIIPNPGDMLDAIGRIFTPKNVNRNTFEMPIPHGMKG
jgi:hypothetical protein